MLLLLKLALRVGSAEAIRGRRLGAGRPLVLHEESGAPGQEGPRPSEAWCPCSLTRPAALGGWPSAWRPRLSFRQDAPARHPGLPQSPWVSGILHPQPPEQLAPSSVEGKAFCPSFTQTGSRLTDPLISRGRGHRDRRALLWGECGGRGQEGKGAEGGGAGVLETNVHNLNRGHWRELWEIATTSWRMFRNGVCAWGGAGAKEFTATGLVLKRFRRR